MPPVSQENFEELQIRMKKLEDWKDRVTPLLSKLLTQSLPRNSGPVPAAAAPSSTYRPSAAYPKLGGKTRKNKRWC